MTKIVVGISGTTGVIYGVRILKALGKVGVETHLVLTQAAGQNLTIETKYTAADVESIASFSYSPEDIGAALASGSFKTEGMVVIPASMKTVAGIAHGYADNLLLRAAEVTLKERRPLIVVPRETPLSVIDIENLLTLAKAGAIVVPAMPAFYDRPKTLDDIIDHLVGKVLDLLGVEHHLYERWEGPRRRSSADGRASTGAGRRSRR